MQWLRGLWQCIVGLVKLLLGSEALPPVEPGFDDAEAPLAKPASEPKDVEPIIVVSDEPISETQPSALLHVPTFDVGMMGVTGPSRDSLMQSFRQISRACNAVQSYGGQDMFGIGRPEGPDRKRTNVQAWVLFAEAVKHVSHDREGPFRCMISRSLTGLRVERGWSREDIRAYVSRLCKRLLDDNLQDYCLGWWFDDEGLKQPSHTVEKFRQLLLLVHETQLEAGLNLPFYFADEPDHEAWWTHSPGRGWIHRVPQPLKERVRFFFTEPSLDSAVPVFMPFYYPGAANNFVYTTKPPYIRWELFMGSLLNAFPKTRYGRLRIMPVLELSEQREGIDPPGHTDVHNQITAAIENGADGIWFMGWNQSGAPNGYAEKRWDEWEEAISGMSYRSELDAKYVPKTTEFTRIDKQFLKGLRGNIFRFTLAEPGYVSIQISNTSGTRLRNVSHASEGSGFMFQSGYYTRFGNRRRRNENAYAFWWDGRDMKSRFVPYGTYRAQLVVNGKEMDSRLFQK